MNVICIYGNVSGKMSVWEGMELKSKIWTDQTDRWKVFGSCKWIFYHMNVFMWITDNPIYVKIVLELSCLIISQVYPSVWIPDVMIMCINVSSIVHSNR